MAESYFMSSSSVEWKVESLLQVLAVVLPLCGLDGAHIDSGRFISSHIPFSHYCADPNLSGLVPFLLFNMVTVTILDI